MPSVTAGAIRAKPGAVPHNDMKMHYVDIIINVKLSAVEKIRKIIIVHQNKLKGAQNNNFFNEKSNLKLSKFFNRW